MTELVWLKSLQVLRHLTACNVRSSGRAGDCMCQAYQIRAFPAIPARESGLIITSTARAPAGKVM